MKLAAAIKVANDILESGQYQGDPDDSAALKILIEAGKRLQEARNWSPLFGQPLLPGETEH